jgi:hypothetical protein
MALSPRVLKILGLFNLVFVWGVLISTVRVSYKPMDQEQRICWWLTLVFAVLMLAIDSYIGTTRPKSFSQFAQKSKIAMLNKLKFRVPRNYQPVQMDIRSIKESLVDMDRFNMGIEKEALAPPN